MAEKDELHWSGSEITLEEERNQLGQQVQSLWCLRKAIKGKKKEVESADSVVESTKKEIILLEIQLQEVNTEKKKLKGEIKENKRVIQRLEENLDGEGDLKQELRKRKQEADSKFVEAQIEAADLHINFEDLHFKFDEHGCNVRESVSERAELHIVLDSLTRKLTEVLAEDSETGADFFDDKDPLQYIENGLPIVQSTVKRSGPPDVSYRENPTKTMEAMDSFVKVIRANLHRFKVLPVGPLYKTMVVKYKRWAPLTEYVLRPFLFSFLVDNIIDGLVLDELISEHFPNSRSGSVNNQGVMCPSQQTYNFNSDYEIGSSINAVSGIQVENMMDVVHCHNHLWTKYLSEKIGLEKIIFMENEHAAFLVMSTIKQTPWHCDAVFTLDGFVVRPFPCFRTKKIRFSPQETYVKCLPSDEIGKFKTKIKKTTKMIASINETIFIQRDKQFKIATELDRLRPLLEKAKTKEKHYFQTRQILEAKLSGKITVDSENAKLKSRRKKKKKLERQSTECENAIQEKKLKLADCKKDIDKISKKLSSLLRRFKSKEAEYFSRRDEFWKREEEENTLVEFNSPN